MLDTQAQLAKLKERIAAIDRRFSDPNWKPKMPELAPAHPSVHSFIEEWAEGQVVTNDFGAHFQCERLFSRHKRHGSADIGALADLPHDLLDAVGENQIPAAA